MKVRLEVKSRLKCGVVQCCKRKLYGTGSGEEYVPALAERGFLRQEISVSPAYFTMR